MLGRILVGYLSICVVLISGCSALSSSYLIPESTDYDYRLMQESDDSDDKSGGQVWRSRNAGRKTAEYLERSQTQNALRQKQQDQKLTDFLDGMLVGYDQRIRPNNNGPPVNTAIQIYLNSFYSLHQENMLSSCLVQTADHQYMFINQDFKVNIFLRLRWNDPRLAHNFTSKPIPLHPSVLSKIWKPDVYFSNEKHANFHTVTTDNKLVRVYQNGDIYSSIRITLTLSCDMHLRHFPMDVQVCNMEMESFGYDMKSLIFDWDKDNAIQLPETLQLPQFLIRGYRLKKCTREYDAGPFTCLGADFILQRQVGYYIIQMYAPSLLIVILSWVAFWINMDATPARIALGITTVLTMTTQSSGARAHLPKVSYVKAIDVWFAMCLVFVFAALLEFALVNFLSRQTKSTLMIMDLFSAKEERDSKRKETVCQLDRLDGDPVTKCKDKKNEDLKKFNRKRAKRIDRVSRILFPGLFILFNVCYWVVYQVARDDLSTALDGATLYFH